MKTTYFKICIIALMFLFFKDKTMAQQGKSDLVFSGTLAHYIRSGIESGTPGFYVYPVDPGLEVLYQYRLGSAFFISSGLSYQTGRIATLKGAERRFSFGEISVPILFKSILVQREKVNLFATAGLSYGQMIHLNIEAPTSQSEWIEIPREFRKYEEHYSEKDAFADLLFGLGVSYTLSPKSEFAILPYFKYRVKDNGMEYFRDNKYYGIKISYQLNFNKNENE